MKPIEIHRHMSAVTLAFSLVIIALFLSPLKSNAQWLPDVRLTTDPAISNTSNNNAWCVAASGNDVHAVWNDNRDGNNEIYYKRSTDGGVSWETDTRLTNNSAYSYIPSISVSGSVVHVVWLDLRDGNWEIYYNRSTDAGISWGADTRLTNHFADSYTPSISVSGSVLHVVWYDNRDNNYEIYYKRSTDGGVSWGADTRLTDNSADSYISSISVSGSVVHVVWADSRDGNFEIYCKRSTDGGITWGADTRLTNNPAYSYYSSVSLSGSVVHVVWLDNRDGDWEMYYKRSTDGGVSWEADTRLTNNPAASSYPSVSVSGSVVHVVWQDNRDGNNEIYYKRSTDGGTSWGVDLRLTSNSAASLYPSVSVSGSVVHVLWQDERDGNWEIYYKRDPTGSVTGIETIDLEIPQQFTLSQNYPNPFNPNTNFSFTIPQSSIVNLTVYDLLGREVALLVNEEKTPGTYTVPWNASGMASGGYVYRIIAGEFVQSRRMILAR